jgi:predicted nucleic acid-binding protein
MVVIDTDVLLLEFAFQEDERQAVNSEFLERVRTAEPAITVYNLMELLGQLSFNLAPAKLDNWREWLIEVYNLNVLGTVSLDDPTAMIYFKSEIMDQPFAKMRLHRMAFMDALALNLAEQTPGVTSFVTWNARHFKNKSTLRVQTPSEYLAI